MIVCLLIGERWPLRAGANENYTKFQEHLRIVTATITCCHLPNPHLVLLFGPIAALPREHGEDGNRPACHTPHPAASAKACAAGSRTWTAEFWTLIPESPLCFLWHRLNQLPANILSRSRILTMPSVSSLQYSRSAFRIPSNSVGSWHWHILKYADMAILPLPISISS